MKLRKSICLVLIIMVCLYYLQHSLDTWTESEASGLTDSRLTSSSNPDTQCSPKNKVAFAKTHKTGSSTLQNIFFRYGDNNNLTFALPDKVWSFTLRKVFNASMVMGLESWGRAGYDMFIFHSIWNYKEVHKILPGATYVTVLRNPVDCFESNYVYMGLQKLYKLDINRFATLKALLNLPRKPGAIIGKNQQMWGLGTNSREMEDMKIVEEKIASYNTQFDLVLIAEYFDESLVLMAELLCWDLSEVRYLKQNARKSSAVSNMTAVSRRTLETFLQADRRLYSHFLKKLNNLIDRYGRERMAKDVARLRQLNEELKKDCVIEVADNSKLEGENRMFSEIVEGYIIDESKSWCKQFSRSEPNFYNHVRDKQIARVLQSGEY